MASRSLGVGSSSSALGSLIKAALRFFAASQCLVQEPWPQQASVHNGSSFDMIIVGAGTAGSTLAARLSQHYSVLLLEAGGDPPQESIIPGLRDSLKKSKYDWNFASTSDGYSSQAFTNGRQYQPRGKMLGGSDSLSDMVYSRGLPVDYDEWTDLLKEDWSWNTVLQYFKRLENMTDERITDDPNLLKYHGQCGPVEVSGLKDYTLITKKLVDSFEELGFEVVNDMTNPEKNGVGRFSHTIKNGTRQSAATAILNKLAKKDNLFVLKHHYVTKILIDDNKNAYGVKVVSDGEELEFFANLEVIVSAGTFNSAKLLILSGIGPKDHLNDLGVKEIQNLPVGDNLHDHIMVLNYVAMEPGICVSRESDSYFNVIKYLYDRTGSLSYSDSMGVLIPFSNSTYPDFTVYPTCVPVKSSFYNSCTGILNLKDDVCKVLDDLNQNYELLTLAIVLLKPKSRGNVRLNSTDPMDPPLIYSGTFSSYEDLQNFPDIVRKVNNIVATSHFKQKNAFVVNIPLENCEKLEADKYLECQCKSMATSAWHSAGTAAMGTVVDPQLRVKGVKGLRVVDASVMPKVVRGNTNAPIMMIAARAADFIRSDYS